jgi:cysteinyl-tRNA synthetase
MAMDQLGASFDLHAGGEDLIFPHHENEIAQSEALTGKQFARFWFHVRFLLVEGEKMSKSLGNFFTLRDLVLKGHKPSSIRYLLTSVPYRNQLNFTFDGLKQAAVSVERLRNFQTRLMTGNFPPGATEEMAALSRETAERMRAGMDDDLNTAQAQGAIFDMVRRANVAMDAGQLKKDDVPVLLAPLEKFNEIFAVLIDDDQPKMKAVLEWAHAEGRETEISPVLVEIAGPAQLTDEQVSQKLAEIEAARKARDFKISDALRAELNNSGINVESTKDGTRWSRKTYKTRLTPLCPVAIKLNQWEVHAPDHSTWGVISCDSCKDKFALGPNRIYGGQASEQKCVKQLEDRLRTDHRDGRPHENSYELED